jgi:class 3 adenylate cyclase
MTLSKKLILIFFILLLVISVIIVIGMPRLFSQIAERQMKKEAETFGLFLLRNIEDIADNRGLDYEEQERYMEDLIYLELEKAIRIAQKTESFIVDEIILISPEYKVEVGYPKDQIGSDYSDHQDIVDNFINQEFLTVLEQHMVDGKPELDIDIVSYLTLNGRPRVLEVKLNFEKSTKLLASQYRLFNLASIGTAFLIILILMIILLALIRRTAIQPAIKISLALEAVGSGDLNVSVQHDSKDEFGMMSLRFNEMVTGLKEKLHLSRYVSKSTMEAVRTAIDSGSDFHQPRRKNVTVFFSDIRGFTTYSESRDPEHIISVLNRILTMQTEIIKRHGGYVDKFVGDEIMALFESPETAMLCSLYIQKGMRDGSVEFEELKIGIGIYEGSAVEGDVGSNDVKNFTVIGDTVNTAARLQSVASGGEILIPDFLAGKESISSRFKLMEKGPIPLKGKKRELTLFKVIGIRDTGK